MNRLILLFLFGFSSCLAEWPNDGFYIGEVPGHGKGYGIEPYKDEKDVKKDDKDVKKDDKDDKDVQKYDFRDEGDLKLRPCTDSDWDCMRKFLASNSGCKPVKGPAPDPLKIPYDKLFFPLVNITITHTNLLVEGFENAKVTEFYVNKKTGNLVIAINVQNLKQTSPKSYFTYLRTGKEPIILDDFTSVTYKSVTFTAIIPNFPHLKLELAEIHADVDDIAPVYVIGPDAFKSTDPDVITAFAEFNKNIPIIVKEAYGFQSYLLTGVFIEKKLCDFGVDVYDNYLKYITTKGYTITPHKYVLDKEYY